jgi:hypothetical protein
LTRPFDTAIAPMTRVVLLRSGPNTPAAIVLTAAHVIADDISAACILRDLFSALNGHELQALRVPPSQEDLIGHLRHTQPADTRAVNSTPPPAQPARLATLSNLRPFDAGLGDEPGDPRVRPQ